MLFNLINLQPDIDKIYLYKKDPYKAKYKFLIKKRKKVDLDILMILYLLLNTQMICKMFIKYSRVQSRKK